MDPRLSVDPGLEGLVRVGALWCDVDRVLANDPGLDAPLASAEVAVRAGDAPDASAGRALYKAIGLDPTRTRPSSEALLRRVLRGEALPRINTLVDICNWCSLDVQLPYGLYDATLIEPPIVLRRGRGGEEYAGIRKDAVHLSGRFVLADRRGPFGNPTSDSARTMTTVRTRQLMVAVFAPVSVARDRMTQVLGMTAARLAEYAGGRETARWVS